MIGKKKHCEISGLRSVDVTIFLRYTPAKRGVFKSKYNSVKIIEKEELYHENKNFRKYKKLA